MGNRIIFAGLFLGFVFFGGAAFGFSGGDGSAGSPYEVSSVGDLLDVTNEPDACYILVNDINLAPATTGLAAFDRAVAGAVDRGGRYAYGG